MNYAQYNDEEIINGVFGDFVGRFLDIGAFDGENLSNTRALALRGWGGVLVEPSPWVFPKMYELYKNEHLITLINSAVSCRSGTLSFWPDTSEHKYGSTLSGEFAEKSHIKGSRPYLVQAIGVKTLLELSGKLDFVSIDTEGHDLEIVCAANWSGVKLLGFEHSTLTPQELEAVVEYLSKQGFTRHASTPPSTYMIRI